MMRTWTRSWTLYGLVLLLAFLRHGASPAAAVQDLGGFTIESFDTELVVESNSDMVVDERIVVNFSAPRRGIFRTIPIRYSDPKGYSYSLDLRLLSATDDAGQPHPTQVTHQGRNVNIRLDDPDRTVEGRVTYVIRYRVRDALSRFGEFDEIYWNATGNEWDATIARATAAVRLPAEVVPERLSASGYTGLFGATTGDVEIRGTLDVSTSDALTELLDQLKGAVRRA